ncbi:hypothetical protein LU699_09725 [Luteimonas fraxinea]|uniref:Uncharacterized protein n=1 Tax=Luteimonas fraxinea TaxID=2901869 RepID=A0ABS8UFV1_9GAMM|nr:hypothetical protein [Luteimonas fraxinea]MCD9097712.1 hypothetical protein [Luteimonas fraxinea]MCD9127575.1 hypothetical protein [Luteimonas fraxinea]UHH08608.1 hypothetical protein LU699_09725 [Luteimonas fraxinea]
MTKRPVLVGACIAAITGIAYWAVVSGMTGGGEPWDAAAYWTLVYPGALLLSAILGFAMPVRAWLWGPIVVFAQVPVVIAVAGAGPLLLAGVLYAAVLSIPAAVISGVAGWIRRRMRGVAPH